MKSIYDNDPALPIPLAKIKNCAYCGGTFTLNKGIGMDSGTFFVSCENSGTDICGSREIDLETWQRRAPAVHIPLAYAHKDDMSKILPLVAFGRIRDLYPKASHGLEDYTVALGIVTPPPNWDRP